MGKRALPLAAPELRKTPAVNLPDARQALRITLCLKHMLNFHNGLSLLCLYSLAILCRGLYRL